MRQMLFFALLFMLLSACATMSRNDCVTADWRAYGLKDGQSGLNRYGKYHKACDKHHVSVNEELYLAGYRFGLKTYCTEDVATRTGLEGHEFRYNECVESSPSQLGLRFYMGRTTYLEEKISAKKKDIADVQQQFRDLKALLAKYPALEKDPRFMARLNELSRDMETLNGPSFTQAW